jgi:DMSO/TMAO reductase YedYZ molybdopterin-dependent catalytic subunit
MALGAISAGVAVTRQLFGQDTLGAAPRAGAQVIRNPRPFDAEAPLDALVNFRTDPDLFFVRSHFGAPASLPLHWTLTIDGEVGRPTTLTLDDIRAMPGAQARTVTLECAGNGRGVYRLPKTAGLQWERGAVSTASWTGVPLGAVLERAGLRPSAQHLWMEGLDRATVPTVPKFVRSISRELALGDAFIAFEMNSGPIPLLHGGPLRLIVPGWFGMTSTKWLTHVHARSVESDNYFMTKGYRYPDGTPVQQMVVKSVIARPLDGARVPVGRLLVQGQAWSGASAGGIRAVDISIDGGRSWRPARLVGPERTGAWRSWEADVDIGATGPHSVMSRATDRRGAVQPLLATPNPGGFANNSIHEVRFDAVRA